ncbi:cysteine desulfurase-like protein [Pseudonocardia ailaonensis]|uniref:Cysteine desulfurase-like protein n=1 Tax=Pseudonocardia ailaonensis TaxID=367279 RepID=A0ABN2MPY0_9PSEU
MGHSYDVAALRAEFPALAAGTAHFDGPGGSQTPAVVARAVADALTSPIANRGTVTAAERHADGIVLKARAAMGDLLDADPRGIVFGRSTTALLFDLARTLSAAWGPGDEIVVTRLDHDANIRPWVLAAGSVGATVRWLDFDPDTTEPDDVATVLSSRTKVVAVTGASNLVGTRPPVAAVAAAAREAGALTVVDGVHLTAHAAIDVSELGADVYACSPYKFCGPHLGVLAARPELLEELHPAKLAPSSDEVPERFELGTLPYELLAGTTAAVDFLAGLAGAHDDRRSGLLAAMAAIEAHEEPLRRRIEAALADLPGVVVRSRAAHRTPTLLVEFADKNPADAYRYLADRKVNAPASSFYALEASRRLGLGDTGSLRIGLSPYTDDSDVDRLLTGLTDFVGLR